MKPIDKSTIRNSQIPHAVMEQVIPLLNKLTEEVLRLRQRVAALEQTGSAPLESVFNAAIAKALGRAGYETLGDLEGVSDETLLAVKGISENRLETIRSRTGE